MVVNQFLSEDLARTRPSHGEMVEALEVLDVAAAHAFQAGVYSEHFRPDLNFWRSPLRAECWARAYVENREHLETAAAEIKRFDLTRLSSMFSDSNVGNTLLHAAYYAESSVLSVSMGTPPVYQSYLEKMQLREAPVCARLATTEDEVELLDKYQSAAIRLADKKHLSYNPGVVLSSATSIPHVLVDALTLVLYAREHDEVDGALYRDVVTEWCGSEDYGVVLQAAEAGLRASDIRTLGRNGVAPEYAFTMYAGTPS